MAFVIYLLWYYVVDQFGQSSLTTHLEWSFPAQIMAAVSLCLFNSMDHHHRHFAYFFRRFADIRHIFCSTVCDFPGPR
jgi:hypothetical protein